MENAFYGCSNLTYSATDAPNLSGVTSMTQMFYNATSFNGNLSAWNVSNVTSMNSTFRNATSFNGDLSTWAVTSVTSLNLMFNGATSFTGNLNGWNVTSVIGMVGVFQGATSFNGDLSGWNVSNVTNMTLMFSGATSFNQNLGTWTLHPAVNLGSTFNNCGMSVANYDATLIGWNNNPSTPSNRSIGVSGLKYCSGANARYNLDVPKGWTFTGDSQDCTGPGTTFESAQSGDWPLPLTWMQYQAPGSSDAPILKSGHTVSLSSGDGMCKELAIEATATLSIGDGRTLTVSTNGITNHGTVNNTASGASSTITGSLFTNAADGTISPGASPGCIAFGSGLTNNGTITIEVNGTTACSQFDRLTVTGTATLGGTLDVTIGYSPTNGDVITFLDATSISGTFATVNPPLPSGWSLAYDSPNAGEVSLQFVVLPVELVSFQAERQNRDAALLTWRTASELNNEGFDIERSSDGRNWETLSFVPGHGTTQAEQSYAYTDEQPLPGVNYYRLRQVDFDGKMEYSDIRSVMMEGSTNGIAVYPNPVKDGLLNVDFAAEQEGTATLRIFDASGKLLHREVLANQHNQTNYGHLSAGI
ncbi:MAG: BspA family leucine-rich repeat surface protein, partial [Saprospiraceae bacterium]|nr:BspA family leucine-rich repeat surface protein [Saprospiraceae bacterium]